MRVKCHTHFHICFCLENLRFVQMAAFPSTAIETVRISPVEFITDQWQVEHFRDFRKNKPNREKNKQIHFQIFRLSHREFIQCIIRWWLSGYFFAICHSSRILVEQYLKTNPFLIAFALCGGKEKLSEYKSIFNQFPIFQLPNGEYEKKTYYSKNNQ